jgi:hypothetical protein
LAHLCFTGKSCIVAWNSFYVSNLCSHLCHIESLCPLSVWHLGQTPYFLIVFSYKNVSVIIPAVVLGEHSRLFLLPMQPCTALL